MVLCTWFESLRNKWIVECESSCDAEIFWISHLIFGTPRQLHQNLFRIERQIQNTVGEDEEAGKKGLLSKDARTELGDFFWHVLTSIVSPFTYYKHWESFVAIFLQA